MNNAQHASMELLANMAKPDVAEAERALELSRSLGLPPRVTGEIEEYIETARRAGGLAKEAKTAQDRATKCWQAVKEQAGRCDDLVDMANSASASRPVAAPSTDDTTEAESESSGPLSGDLAADMAKRFPAVVDFFAIPRSDAATQKYLVSLPVTTNDDYQPSLVRLGRAVSFLIEQNEVGEPLIPLVYAIVHHWLERCETQNCAPQMTSAFKPHSAAAILKPVAPSVLDILQGHRPIKNATDEQLRLAARAWAYWDNGIATAKRGADISAEVARRESATKKEPKKEPLRGLDRAAQEGRRNWNLEGKHATSYNKPTYREAYERGWNDCYRAYEEGRAAAQSEDGSPGNPYHGADPDNAIAHAYELGVTSVISPESMPPVSKDDDSNDEEDDTDE